MPRYFSTWGPTSGPIRWRDCGHALGVALDPSKPPMPDGTAFPVGMLDDDGRGAWAVFRLVLGKTELAGRWVCVDRQFVPVESLDGDESGAFRPRSDRPA